MSKAARFEYDSLCENMRWYSSIRLAQLTLFLAANGAFLGYFAAIDQQSDLFSNLIRGSALISVMCFWLMEERASHYWRHFRSRAIYLETELGYCQFCNAPRPWGRFNTTHLLRLFFVTVLLFWISSYFVF